MISRNDEFDIEYVYHCLKVKGMNAINISSGFALAKITSTNTVKLTTPRR